MQQRTKKKKKKQENEQEIMRYREKSENVKHLSDEVPRGQTRENRARRWLEVFRIN